MKTKRKKKVLEEKRQGIGKFLNNVRFKFAALKAQKMQK